MPLRALGLQSRAIDPACQLTLASALLILSSCALAPCSSSSFSLTRLLRIRANLYELLTNVIPPDVIMKKLTEVLLRRVDDEIKHEIVQEAAFYDHRMHQGSKPIFHMEAFVAKFMAIYKRWCVESFG